MGCGHNKAYRRWNWESRVIQVSRRSEPIFDISRMGGRLRGKFFFEPLDTGSRSDRMTGLD